MINNLKNMLKSAIALFGIVSMAMLTVYALSAHHDFKSTIEPNLTFGVWLILVMTFMVFTIAGLLIIGEFAAPKQYIPIKIKNKIYNNVRAFRHPETGEIRYALIGTEADEVEYEKWESVIIMPDLTNQEIDYLLEN